MVERFADNGWRDRWRVLEGEAGRRRRPHRQRRHERLAAARPHRLSGPCAIEYQGEMLPGCKPCDLSLIWCRDWNSAATGWGSMHDRLYLQFGAIHSPHLDHGRVAAGGLPSGPPAAGGAPPGANRDRRRDHHPRGRPGRAVPLPRSAAARGRVLHALRILSGQGLHRRPGVRARRTPAAGGRGRRRFRRPRRMGDRGRRVRSRCALPPGHAARPPGPLQAGPEPAPRPPLRRGRGRLERARRPAPRRFRPGAHRRAPARLRRSRAGPGGARAARRVAGRRGARPRRGGLGRRGAGAADGQSRSQRRGDRPLPRRAQAAESAWRPHFTCTTKAPRWWPPSAHQNT